MRGHDLFLNIVITV